MDVREKSLNEKRLIDANRALEIVHDQRIAHPNAYHLTTYATLILREAPTVDAVEVAHGRWVSVPHKLSRVCSVCNLDEPYKFADIDADVYDYCPYCGAKMDLEG